MKRPSDYLMSMARVYLDAPEYSRDEVLIEQALKVAAKREGLSSDAVVELAERENRIRLSLIAAAAMSEDEEAVRDASRD